MPDDLSGYPSGEEASDLPPGATAGMMSRQRLDILRGEMRSANEDGAIGFENDQSREQYFLVGTLGALGHIVQGLVTLPGRKSVVLLSDGVSILTAEGKSKRIMDGLRRVTDQANRASVVLYTIDPRGVQPMGVTAATSLTESNPFLVANSRKLEYFEGQRWAGVPGPRNRRPVRAQCERSQRCYRPRDGRPKGLLPHRIQTPRGNLRPIVS